MLKLMIHFVDLTKCNKCDRSKTQYFRCTKKFSEEWGVLPSEE